MNRAALAAALRLSSSLPKVVHQAPSPDNDPEEFHRRAVRRVGNGANQVRSLPGGEKVKRCSGCQVDHPVAAFNRGNAPGGLSYHCRDYRKRWLKGGPK